MKADGYGHGALESARAAIAGGAGMLAVAAAAEAKALHVRDIGMELHGGLEVLGERVRLEGVEAVDRDAAADHVEVRGG